MNKIYENIINEGKKSGKAVETINAELKEAGANFHLNPDGGVAGWTEDEMREGFLPGDPAKDAQRTVDMRRREDLAGTKQIQWVPGGKFEVEYDELGYAKSAVEYDELGYAKSVVRVHD